MTFKLLSEYRIYILAQTTAFHRLVYLYRLNVCGVRIACHPNEYLAMYQWIREGRHIPTMRMVEHQGDTYTMAIVCARLPVSDCCNTVKYLTMRHYVARDFNV